MFTVLGPDTRWILSTSAINRRVIVVKDTRIYIYTDPLLRKILQIAFSCKMEQTRMSVVNNMAWQLAAKISREFSVIYIFIVCFELGFSYGK